MMSINPDAYSIAELDHMHSGVEIACKDGVPPAPVLNAMKLANILRLLKARRTPVRRAAE